MYRNKIIKHFLFLFILLACFQPVSGQDGKAWSQKIAPTLLEKARDGQSVPFLIVLKDQADVSAAAILNTKNEKATYVFNTLREHADRTQKSVISYLKNKQVSCQSLFIINAIKAEGNMGLINALAQRTDVARLLNNSTMSFAQPVEWYAADNNSRSTIEWGIDMINADDVWALGYRGQGVVVGGEDTGYEWNHPALKLKYRGYDADLDTVDHNYNWHDAIHSISPLSSDSINPCGLDVQAPCDDYGHGTHTMGTMIGSDSLNEIGVAPDAKWCACRNMERGNGSPFTYIECFQWFLAPTDLKNENPDPAKAPDVINNSWGCPVSEGCDSSNWAIMNEVVNSLRLGGIVVVVSAGNSGSGCSSVDDPAAIYEGSFSVGATAQNDTIAGFSSRGPVTVDGSNRLKPNVSAPGVHVRSSVPGGNYANSSGTSMAGPHVVGLVALMISANPELAGKVEVIESLIEQTAVPKTTDQICGDIPGSEIPNNTYGFGRIDALAAVQAALAFTPVSTNDHQEFSDIQVYPNPVVSQLHIDLFDASGEAQIELFDLQGRLILQQHESGADHSSFTLDLSNRPAGIYFYRISIHKEIWVGKVVKKD